MTFSEDLTKIMEKMSNRIAHDLVYGLELEFTSEVTEKLTLHHEDKTYELSFTLKEIEEE